MLLFALLAVPLDVLLTVQMLAVLLVGLLALLLLPPLVGFHTASALRRRRCRGT